MTEWGVVDVVLRLLGVVVWLLLSLEYWDA